MNFLTNQILQNNRKRAMDKAIAEKNIGTPKKVRKPYTKKAIKEGVEKKSPTKKAVKNKK